jgi:hypothetical protein
MWTAALEKNGKKKKKKKLTGAPSQGDAADSREAELRELEQQLQELSGSYQPTNQ